MQKAYLTTDEVFDQLDKLKPQIEQFEADGTGTLKPEHLVIMQGVYPSVQVLSMGGLPVKLDASCDTCIREAFRVMASLYRRTEAKRNEQLAVDSANTPDPTAATVTVPEPTPEPTEAVTLPPAEEPALEPLQPDAMPVNTPETVTPSQAAAKPKKGAANA